MYKFLIFSFLGTFLLEFQPVCAEIDRNQKRPYSYRYEQWRARNRESGLFDSEKGAPITETVLLLQLNKRERQKFRSLPEQARLDVLEFVNMTGTSDYERVIDDALQRESSKVGYEQEIMLNKGMNRIH